MFKVLVRYPKTDCRLGASFYFFSISDILVLSLRLFWWNSYELVGLFSPILERDPMKRIVCDSPPQHIYYSLMIFVLA